MTTRTATTRPSSGFFIAIKHCATPTAKFLVNSHPWHYFTHSRTCQHLTLTIIFCFFSVKTIKPFLSGVPSKNTVRVSGFLYTGLRRRFGVALVIAGAFRFNTDFNQRDAFSVILNHLSPDDAVNNTNTIPVPRNKIPIMTRHKIIQ